MQKLLKSIRLFKWSDVRVQLGIVFLVTLIAYSNIFQNEFIGDDFTFIEEWELTRRIENIPELLSGELPDQHTGVYRPIRGMVYLLMYQLFNTNPFWYHAFSISVHLLVTCLIYFITVKISKSSEIAFMASLIFGVHPIHTEAVTFVTASFDTFSFVFLLSSFYLYITNNSDKKKGLILASLALLSNEVSVILVGLLILYELLLNTDNYDMRIKRLFPYLTLTFIYLLLRFFILDIPTRTHYVGNTFLLTLLVSLKSFLVYVFVTLFPIKIQYVRELPGDISNYMFEDLYISYAANQSFLELSVLLSISLIIIGVGISLYFWKKQPLIPFALGWFVIALIPVLNIIPSALLFSERYVYLASFGFCLLIGWLFFSLFRKFSMNRNLISVVFGVIVLSFGVRTFLRNFDWSNEVVFWESEESHTKDNALLYYKLGAAYYKKGKLEKADNSFSRATELAPMYADAYIGAGLTALKRELYDIAIINFEKAVEVNFMYISSVRNPVVHSYLQLAKQAYQQNDIEKSEVYIEKAISYKALDSGLLLEIQRFCELLDEGCTNLQN